ncbi:MAG: NAD(P)-dependent oxidoreductase [Phycisphaerales bacterium]
MRIALTGASGFIGSVLARQLHEKGHRVTALVRQTSRRDHIEPYVDRLVVGGQADESVWPELLEAAECVIHNSVDWRALKPLDLDAHLRSNLNGSIKLLHAAAPRQLIFVSTIAVHHDMRPKAFDDEGRGLIDEDHPLRPAMLYGAYKAAVEAHLWSAHFSTGQNTCAVRPCGVYGIDPNLSRSHGYKLLKALAAGKPWEQEQGGKFVHVEDTAAAIVACVGNDDAAGRPFNLVDCYARWADWARMAGEILGLDARVNETSPPSSKNVFLKHEAKSLGVGGKFLERGHEGIRQHLEELAEVMRAKGEL